MRSTTCPGDRAVIPLSAMIKCRWKRGGLPPGGPSHAAAVKVYPAAHLAEHSQGCHPVDQLGIVRLKLSGRHDRLEDQPSRGTEHVEPSVSMQSTA